MSDNKQHETQNFTMKALCQLTEWIENLDLSGSKEAGRQEAVGGYHVRSVVFQLSGRSLNLYAALDSQYEKLSQGQTLPTTQDLLDILGQLLLEFRRTYIVLDALDEAETRIFRIVELLSKLRIRTKSSLHLLFTSQPREIFMVSSRV
ncbi:hypothetical protein C8J57DRAFT_1249250 [Mycena rebaudengoi]|nr:hypothetical protein C8J57DRAFT_1249250 [Mycena rebaudengoi]